jgi:formiminotetrahydrofolate cyclodeaminase
VGSEDSYMRLALEEFLEEIATADLLPGGGFVSGYAVAMAAGLVAMIARLSSEHWPEARTISAQAQTLRRRVTPLAALNAESYSAAIAALRGGEDGSGESGRDEAIANALQQAAHVPLQIGEVACDVAVLAAAVAERGEPGLRADAVVAALLAQACARAAATLVEVNLGTIAGDERLTQARDLAGTATVALERALAAVNA